MKKHRAKQPTQPSSVEMSIAEAARRVPRVTIPTQAAFRLLQVFSSIDGFRSLAMAEGVELRDVLQASLNDAFADLPKPGSKRV